jgi:hypothetical protein
MFELKIKGYNTLDCHTIFSLFLAVTIRVVNQPYVKVVITRMYCIFNVTSKKVINTNDLEQLHK